MYPKLNFVFSIILALIILGALFFLGDFKTTLSLILNANLLWIVFALLIYNINWFLRGLRWKKILNEMSIPISLLDSTSLVVLGNMANVVLPAKIGDLIKPAILKTKNGISFTKGLSSVIIDRIMDFVGVAILTFVSLALLLPFPSFPGWINFLLQASLALVVILAIIAVILVKTSVFPKLLDLFSKINYVSTKKLFLLETFEEIKNVLRIPTLALLLIQSIILWIFEAVITFIVIQALNIHGISFFLILFAIMVANLTKTLPLTPEGIGIYQAAIAAVFLVGGVPVETGLAIGILDHAVKIFYTLLLGVISLSYTGLSFGEIAKIHSKSA